MALRAIVLYCAHKCEHNVKERAIMNTRIQFRIEVETKSLAMQALEKKGISLSTALREFIKNLAQTETNMQQSEDWLKAQISETYNSIERGEYQYYSEEDAEAMIDNLINSALEKDTV